MITINKTKIMNQPYIKIYKNGKLTNPVNGMFVNEFKNRSERRSKPIRFKGNTKGINLTVNGTVKVRRIEQFIHLYNKKTRISTGEVKRIERYQ